MVQYGKALINAKRIGWEDAYLDYNGLKKVVAGIEGNLAKHTTSETTRLLHAEYIDTISRHDEFRSSSASKLAVDALKTEFFSQLGAEIEKMSLFTLKKQGQLADAVGTMRFDHTSLFDESSSLLLSVRCANKLEMYAALGVEMLHLLKFICVNSIGVQKILKKYNKAFEEEDEPHFYYMASDHLQQLANSKSIVAVQSSLQSALADSYREEDATSGDNATSFFRFQCIMECSYTLQDHASTLQAPFLNFLSKQSRIVTGANFGDMDRRGQRALDWLLKLRPEDMLRMDTPQLEEMWNRWGGVVDKRLTFMPRRALDIIREEDLEELSLADKSTDSPIKYQRVWGGVDAISMILNLLSILLYTINYYIVAPTANHYAIELGADGALGATLIGASSFSAIFSAFAYSLWYTKSTFKSALLFSSLCPLVGNLIYALAISYNSLPMAITGRILCGFGSAEVLNRQVISACVHFEGMTQASALFVAFGASGMSIGPLIAGILDMTAGRDMNVDLQLPFLPAGGLIYNHVTAPGFIMAFMWLVQFAGLFFLFREPIRINSSAFTPDNSPDYESDDDEGIVLRLESQHSTRGSSYGSIESSRGLSLCMVITSSTGKIWHELVSTWKLVFANAGLPITLLIFSFIELVDEVIISSCSMVVRRYFGWSGAVAGFFLASLGALVLPAHFVVEKASRHLSERKILFRSLVVVIACLMGIFNYSGLVYDVAGSIITQHVEDEEAIKETKINGERIKQLMTPAGEIYYDWGFGESIYMLFLSLLFMATIVLEGVDTSIMAKVTPAKLNDKFINSGLLATLIGTVGRVFADTVITAGALLDINIFVDFLNAAFFPLLLLGLGCLYITNSYYRSLV